MERAVRRERIGLDGSRTADRSDMSSIFFVWRDIEAMFYDCFAFASG